MRTISHGTRRIGALLIGLALILTATAIVASPFAAARRAKHPTPRLTLVHSSPITISGRGFGARRRVTVTLTSGRTYSRRPRANGNGRFTVAFPATLDRCTYWSVTATQPHHGVVTLRGRPKPECAPL